MGIDKEENDEYVTYTFSWWWILGLFIFIWGVLGMLHGTNLHYDGKDVEATYELVHGFIIAFVGYLMMRD